MDNEFFLGLVYNASLLLAIVLVFDLMTSYFLRNRTFMWKIVSGVIIGGIGLSVMQTNWELLPGVVFDTRSVLLGATGLFFGWVPTIIAMAITAIYRIYQGGSGVLMGVPVIILSSLIGLVWRAFRLSSLDKISWLELYIFGLVVHIGMMACTFLLPVEIRASVQSSIWLPVMTIYPVATLLLCSLMSGRLRREKIRDDLAESEEKYKFLFQTLDQGVVIQDSKGTIVEANKAAETILGLKSEQMLGMTSLDPRWKMINEDGSPLNPDDTPSNIVLKTRKPVVKMVMGIYIPENNDYKWILNGSTPRFRKENGELYLTLTSFTDITELKKTQDSLKESEQKLQNAQKMAQLGYWIWDIKTGKVEWTDEVYKIFRLDRKTFKPQIDSILKMSPWPEDNNRGNELIERAIKSHKIGTYDQKFLRPNGEIGYYHSSFQGKYDESGKLVSIVGTIMDITDQINAQRRIKESENKFHGLFDSMIEGVALHEMLFDESDKPVNYRINDVNPSYRKQTGIEEEVKGKLATEAYKTDKPPYLEEFAEVVKTGKPKVFETSFNPLGKTFKIAVFAIKNHQFATIFEDITQQNKLIEDLKKSEEKFSKAFKTSPYIIIMTKMDDGTIMDVNDAFCKLSGYTREEALNSSTISLKLWGNVGDRQKVLEELKSGKSIANREYQFRKKNGEVLTGSFSTQVIQIKGVQYILSSIEDISKRKEDEKKIAMVNDEILNEKHKLENILRDIGDAVIVTDVEKRIIMMNKAMEETFGFSEKEIVGKKIDEVLKMVNASSGEKPEELFKKVYEQKKIAKPKETLAISKNGANKILADGIVSPIIDEKNKLTGTVWVLRDVSKEKELEKMRMDFISLASHQLRTPLTGIKWFVELLDKSAPELPAEKIHEYINKIGESNNRMIELVNDLLTTSRADSGKFATDKSSYKVKDIIQQAIDEQGRLFLDKKIVIKGMSEIPDDISIDVDLVQAVQIIGNLLSNAANYSAIGTVIEVGVNQEGDRVKIFVRDHGVGIPTEQQDKIFTKFFRADNVAKTVPGSGLGLYVAKSMVESHGGKIWFESKENMGTTFFVELPIKKKMDKKKKVMIVEDDTVLANALSLALQSEGYELSLATDGDEAERMIKQEVPDLVLLDLLLPIKNGFEVLKQMRQDPKTKDIAVVILTNFEQETSINEGKKLGALDYIVKANIDIQDVPKIVKKNMPS